ncbi:hypothetical protein CVT24_007445 [Panaeolus cyanescens]|uniref:Uncharacterized protein n=1 Tax=Panaeolus cyanescens TaxID=181874 RepID=A0A409W4V5_9AGAR|nr:hypothetical protein CVT24_007445 [Panaeolus cyanescens]
MSVKEEPVWDDEIDPNNIQHDLPAPDPHGIYRLVSPTTFYAELFGKSPSVESKQDHSDEHSVHSETEDDNHPGATSSVPRNYNLHGLGPVDPADEERWENGYSDESETESTAPPIVAAYNGPTTPPPASPKSTPATDPQGSRQRQLNPFEEHLIETVRASVQFSNGAMMEELQKARIALERSRQREQELNVQVGTLTRVNKRLRDKTIQELETQKRRK